MEEVVTYISPALRANYDPTHTTSLRNQFAMDMKRRLAELRKVIKVTVVDNDAFGLNQKTIQIHQMSPAGVGAFNFSRSSDKVQAFMVWLQQQVDRGILDIRTFQQVGQSVDAAWTNKYIYDSYKRGVMRARFEMVRAGYDVPSMEQTGGINASMMLPFHVDRVGLLYTRTYNDLKGITETMDSLISRILAQGIADGDGPVLLAKKILEVIKSTGAGELGITDTIGRFISATTRAITLARTEIIRAHHVATIQEYRNWGVLGIKVLAEWQTAGDHRVCKECASQQGKIYTLDEIEPLIPFHPNCRCIALPYIEELLKYEN